MIGSDDDSNDDSNDDYNDDYNDDENKIKKILKKQLNRKYDDYNDKEKAKIPSYTDFFENYLHYLMKYDAYEGQLDDHPNIFLSRLRFPPSIELEFWRLEVLFFI